MATAFSQPEFVRLGLLVSPKPCFCDCSRASILFSPREAPTRVAPPTTGLEHSCRHSVKKRRLLDNMRIVQFVNNLDIGGLERLVIDLAQCQLAEGHQATIYSLTHPGRLAAEAEGMGIC